MASNIGAPLLQKKKIEKANADIQGVCTDALAMIGITWGYDVPKKYLIAKAPLGSGVPFSYLWIYRLIAKEADVCSRVVLQKLSHP